MRGIGDPGRGGASLGGGPDGGLGGGTRDPHARDRRSDDFRGRLADALGGPHRPGEGSERGDLPVDAWHGAPGTGDGRRDRDSTGGGATAAGTSDGDGTDGAAAMLALFQPRAPSPEPADGASPRPTASVTKRRSGAAAHRSALDTGDLAAADAGVAPARPPETPRRDGGLRLLASSAEADAALSLAGGPAPFPQGRCAQGGSGSQGDAEAGVERPGAAQAERVAARLEASLRADAAVDGPVTIAVPVAPGLDGITGVSITVTSGGLDVVLDRVAGVAVSDGLAAAAQDLVARLQKRYPRGAVRVLEAVRADPTAGAVDGPADQASAGRRPA